MTKITSLLTGAGLGAMLIAGASPAAAKVGQPTAAERQQAEIEALRREVEALTARLDAQQQAASQAQATAQAAQQQARAAQSQAAAAQAAVPVEVKTQLAAAPTPKPQWFDNTSISGRMYFNFSNIGQKANGVESAANGTGFNIKRFYLSVDHKFDDTFSADITTDVSNVIGDTSGKLVGRGLYIKKAYLQAKLGPALVVRLGSADMPWIPYAENQYGYRHIENTLIDRIGYGNSADWGVHVLGDLAGGLVSYQLSVVDGAGYRNVKVTNSVDVEGRVSVQYKGLFAAIGGYSGKRGADVEGAVTHHSATRIDAMLGYKSRLFTIGGEYFHARNWNNVATVGEDKAEGWSLFGNINFAPRWSAFGRYDWVKPSGDANPRLKDHYFNVGIQYEPVKIVDLALVYKRDVARNGLIATSNGTIGGSNPPGLPVGGRGTYDEIGLFGQLRW